ncbi:twin-arginine translocase subunit TatC [Microbacterium ulmi]|uniref:Sec-independent protein translocase protein TatC n=2 Tax=Microbacterium ulmi TaxID=179095 RepID=A0A7Y2M1U2_9MICO|nr:twin-arginine translocase subunit TatC [Microbacterium ulmi]NNH04936.1 twin-arginine translocase subunit TatC [Microbacterium ulmi]
MPVRNHLAELRRRLYVSLAAVAIAAVVAFILTDPVIRLLTEPIRLIADERGADLAALNFDSVTAAFDLRMRIALTVGLIAAAPVWISQALLFVLPALTRRETRRTLVFVLVAVPLFFAGCVTGWLIAPHAIALMSSFVPEGAAQFFQSSRYYDFVLKLIIAVGVAFVLPVLLVLLNVLGVVSAKAILHGWRVAVVVAATFAALATPAADIVSMLLLAGVLVALYLAAAATALVIDRRRAKARRRELAADGIRLPAEEV